MLLGILFTGNADFSGLSGCLPDTDSISGIPYSQDTKSTRYEYERKPAKYISHFEVTYAFS